MCPVDFIIGLQKSFNWKADFHLGNISLSCGCQISKYWLTTIICFVETYQFDKLLSKCYLHGMYTYTACIKYL